MTDTPETTSNPTTPSSLSEQLLSERPEVRKKTLIWSGLFVAVFTVVLLVVSISDLRMFDPVFFPGTLLLVVVSLVFGFRLGATWTLRDCRKRAERLERRGRS